MRPMSLTQTVRRALPAAAMTALLALPGTASADDDHHRVTAADGSRPGDPFSPSVATPDAHQDESACEAGDMAACYAMANRYHGGDGVVRDNLHSVALVRQACEGGYPRACYDLGARHLLGEYVEQDAAEALTFILQACDGDDAVACYFAGTLSRDGVGVPLALDVAGTLFERACTLGYRDACQEGVQPTYVPGEEARVLGANAPRELAAQARLCDAGYMSGCARLANAYANGDGVNPNAERAAALHDRACDWGLLPSCEALGR